MSSSPSDSTRRMLDPTHRGPPEDNTVKCQGLSLCSAINYTLLYLVLSTGYEIVIKTAYLSLVNMQTDDLRELGRCVMSSESQ